MKEYRPYKDKSDEWLIDEIKKEDSNSGLFWALSIASVMIALMWIYLRIAFWITIMILLVLFITELFKDNKTKERYLKDELKIRKRGKRNETIIT